LSAVSFMRLDEEHDLRILDQSVDGEIAPG
jgi:hypothetical protein